MYIAYILIIDVTPLLILCFEQKGGEEFVGFIFTLTPLLMIDKKWEKYFSIYYMHVFGKRIYVYASYNKQINMWEKWFWEKGGEGFL